jgi:thiamine biosynthesis lipoprotein
VTWYALELSQLSHGAFDPTLGPVIDLWGFGSAEPPDGEPAPEEVAKALARTGADLVEVVDGLHLAKKRPDVELNLSAVVEGFALDGLSLLLADHGLTNTYAEIGGEIVVRGVNPQGTPWRIGVDLPEPGSYPGEHIVRVVTPGDKAIATSGDYRNYRVDTAGRRRSHLINPATGFPIDHRLASVSVIASSCMAADGIATTLMIMGDEAGMAWIATQPHAEALFIIRNDAGEFDVRQSTGFDAYLAE